MDTKIQELTDKIYNEGVEKGNIEAQRIIDAATLEAQKTIERANLDAVQITADAEKKAAELKKNTEAELKLFAAQSVEALKTEIANLLTQKIATTAVESATTEKDFMSKLILTLVEEWAKKDTLTIQAKDAASLQKYFNQNAKELLTKGIKIEQVNGIKSNFEIQSADGGYKVTFGNDEFINYFKEFLRPQLIEMLF